MSLPPQRPPVVLLVTASSFSPFAMALCIPALPTISREFAITNAEVQFAISVYLFGLALAQPLHGVLADRYGRRPILIGGFILFTIASFACAFAQNMLMLSCYRLLQAMGIATATVVSRAIIRDTSSSADDSARYIAWLAAGMGIAPMLAPLLSGYFIENSGWRQSFIATAILASGILLWLLKSLPETRRHIESVEKGMTLMWNNIRTLFRSRSFWAYTLIFGFINAAFFAFLTNAPAFFQNVLAVGPARFGVYIGAMSLFYIIGAALGGMLIKAYGMEASLRYGLIGTSVTAVLILLIISNFAPGISVIVLPFFLLFACAGLVNPPAMAGAVMHHPERAATAAGLSSSLGMAISGLSIVLNGTIYNGSIFSLCVPVCIAIFITALIYIVLLGTGSGRAAQ
ncbi:MAG: multidrug effflux MFS transporter [Gammaproteobacteria bacterium]